jgi:RNA polymerase sigma-70 factor (ECF subfamily)
MISDGELVARITGSNDQDAFRMLVERHQAAVRGFLRRLTAGDLGTADDLAQDTFLMAYQKLHTLKTTASLNSWLHTIAYRRFLQHTRRQGRQTPMAQPPDSGADPRSAVDAEILAPRLLRLVSAEERVCLTLAYAAGMSHPEICAVTDLPLGTVKSHIQRGKQKLQKWLQKHDHSLSRESVGQAAEEASRA